MDRTSILAGAARGPSTPDGPADLAVETQGLVKRFGKVVAVDGVDVRVERGHVYGLLGPNGAGKTTLIRLLATLLRPTSGSARVLGHDTVRESDEVRERIALTGQYASVDEDLTGRENLVLIARLLGYRIPAARRRASGLLAAFGLADAAERQVKKYSGGMRRRIDIAASIVVTPELLFLDEPTTGLDPRSRIQVWNMVRELVASGTTVLLTTQYLDEVDALAGRIAVIDHGRIIAEGTSGELKASIGSGAVRVRLHDPDQRDDAAERLGRVLDGDVVREADPVLLSARTDDPALVADGLRELVRSGIGVADFSLGQPSLDEVFLALTGHPATTPQSPATDGSAESSQSSTTEERP